MKYDWIIKKILWDALLQPASTSIQPLQKASNLTRKKSCRWLRNLESTLFFFFAALKLPIIMYRKSKKVKKNFTLVQITSKMLNLQNCSPPLRRSALGTLHRKKLERTTGNTWGDKDPFWTGMYEMVAMACGKRQPIKDVRLKKKKRCRTTKQKKKRTTENKNYWSSFAFFCVPEPMCTQFASCIQTSSLRSSEK